MCGKYRTKMKSEMTAEELKTRMRAHPTAWSHRRGIPGTTSHSRIRTSGGECHTTSRGDTTHNRILPQVVNVKFFFSCI